MGSKVSRKKFTLKVQTVHGPHFERTGSELDSFGYPDRIGYSHEGDYASLNYFQTEEYFSDPILLRSSIDDGDQSSPLRIRAYVYDGHHGSIQQISMNTGTPQRLNNNEIDFEEDSLSNRSTNTETVLKTSQSKSCCDNSQPNNSDILYAIDYKESDASSSETYTLEVEYMITVFQPLLVDTIRVSDVLPYIDFLDPRDFDEKTNPREAVATLLSKLKASMVPGKWTTFFEALERAGYEYIKNLLRGDTQKDHSNKRELLKLLTPQLMDRMDPEEFTDHLLAKGVINDRDKEEVQCQRQNRGPTAACLMLLDKIPRRASNWVEIFREVLRECGLADIAENFETDSNSTLSNSFTDVKRPVRNRRSNKQYTTPAYGQWRPLPELPRNRSWHNRKQLQSDGSASLHLTNIHERSHIERNNGAHLLNNGGYEFHENIENGKAQTDTSKEIATLYQRLMEDIKEEISKQIENVKDHVTNTVTNALLYSGSIRTFASEPPYATVDSLPTDSNYRPIPIYTTGRRSHFLQRPTFYTDPVFDTSVDSGTSNIQSYTV